MQKLKNEIAEKKLQMRVLEQRMAGSYEESSDSIEMSQVIFFLFFFPLSCLHFAFTARR